MIMQILIKAFIVGISLSILLGMMSYFVVMRKMTFAGVGIAHSVFGGMALSFVLGLTSMYVPLAFTIIASLVIAFMYKRGGLTEDSAIDVIFVSSMAFGVFILSLSSGYSANLLGILFGNILSVTTSNVYIAIFVFILGVLLINMFFSQLQLVTYNEELASINGIKTDALYYAFWVGLGIIIVLSVKLIGIILVNAFLVLPSLIGMNLTRSYKGVFFFAAVSSALSVMLGIIISYFINTPTGASIVLVLVGLWILSIVISKVGSHK